MARKLRIQFEGAIYHVTLRGVDRRRLFDDDADRERFLARLRDAVDTHAVRLFLFCCMLNHVHLLCETPRANLSAFMHALQTAYSVYYNRRHHRAGHLTQGRFGANLVAGDLYLLKLSRYIHLNPVALRTVTPLPVAERIRRLRAYRWSSYRGYAGLAKPYDWVDEGPILKMSGGASMNGRRRAYRRYVESGLAETDAELSLVLQTSRWGIGGEAFQTRVRAQHADRALHSRRPEDVSFRRTAPAVSITQVLEVVAQAFGVAGSSLRLRQYNCEARAVAAFMLGRYAGLNQREIAVLLGMGTGSAVCRQLQRLRARQTHDPVLTEHMEHIRATLRGAAKLLTTMLIVKG